MEESDLKGRTALRPKIYDLLQFVGRPFVKVDTGPIAERVRNVVGNETTAENMSIVKHKIVLTFKHVYL